MYSRSFCYQFSLNFLLLCFLGGGTESKSYLIKELGSGGGHTGRSDRHSKKGKTYIIKKVGGEP